MVIQLCQCCYDDVDVPINKTVMIHPLVNTFCNGCGEIVEVHDDTYVELVIPNPLPKRSQLMGQPC